MFVTLLPQKISLGAEGTKGKKLRGPLFFFLTVLVLSAPKLSQKISPYSTVLYLYVSSL
jgi:hypothetical protein